jgi:hypothetical protein
MDCRTFRQHHCAFVDDVLPGADIVAMELHRTECATCGAYDARVRRSLLLVRNVPPVECSADFTERLYRRLQEVDVERTPTLGARGPGRTRVAAAAALLLAAAGGTYVLAGRAPDDIVLRPVVATTPAPVAPSDPLVDPVIAASASAGMPMWPALMLADELPMRVVQPARQSDGFVSVAMPGW